jgi:hypothetical protein
MWALIIAGHISQTFNSHGECQNAASVTRGALALSAGGPKEVTCIQLAPPSPASNDGGFGLYQQCVQVGACKPF